MKKSAQCPSAAERITAASIIHGIGPQKYASSARSELVVSSAISFGPYRARRSRASTLVRPSAENPSCFLTSASGTDFRSLL